MESLLCLTFQARDVNNEHGNMVHDYLLDKNFSINWDNDDTISLVSFSESPPADLPDYDLSDIDDQHKLSMSSGNNVNHGVGPPDNADLGEGTFAVKSIDEVTKLTEENFCKGLDFQT